jgi:prevent-host-death family protein
MRTKTTLSISEARKNIFLIAEEVQKKNAYYTLTERGRPKVVMLSAERFESLIKKKMGDFMNSVLGEEKTSSSWGYVLADEARENYEKRENIFHRALILRDDSMKKYSYKKGEDPKFLEDEYIKALLYVGLIEKYGYPIRYIELGRYIRTNGEERKRYIEVDIVINDKNNNAEIIFEVTSFHDYEKSRGKIIQDLFDIAGVINWGGKLKYLVYYSRSNENDALKEKISVIDYKKYKNFASWKKAGMPTENKIPAYLA